MAHAKPVDSVRRAQTGDVAALDALWRAHRRWVAAVLLAHRPRGADLEDLLQDVALALVEKIRDLRDPERLRPWLRRVAMNVARGAGRKLETRRKCMRPVVDSDHNVRDRFDERGRAQTRDDLERVLGVVETLPPEYSEPLLLRSVRGFRQREIAELLALSVTTVETRLARARRMLRERLLQGWPVTGSVPKAGEASDTNPQMR